MSSMTGSPIRSGARAPVAPLKRPAGGTNGTGGTCGMVRNLRTLERTIARLRAEQVACLIATADTEDAPTARDLAEWLDISHSTAADLLELAAGLVSHPVLFAALAHGDATVDRARAIVRMRARSADTADGAWGYHVDELDQGPTGGPAGDTAAMAGGGRPGDDQA